MRKLFYFNKKLFPFVPDSLKMVISFIVLPWKKARVKDNKGQSETFYYYSCQGYRYKDTKLWQLVVTGCTLYKNTEVGVFVASE